MGFGVYPAGRQSDPIVSLVQSFQPYFTSSCSVVVVVVTLTRIVKSVVTGQVLVTLEWNNTPRKKSTNKNKSGTRIYHS